MTEWNFDQKCWMIVVHKPLSIPSLFLFYCLLFCLYSFCIWKGFLRAVAFWLLTLIWSMSLRDTSVGKIWTERVWERFELIKISTVGKIWTETVWERTECSDYCGELESRLKAVLKMIQRDTEYKFGPFNWITSTAHDIPVELTPSSRTHL